MRLLSPQILVSLMALAISVCRADTVRLEKFTIDLTRPRQSIDNFAASDSWTIDPVGVWSEASKTKVADLLFSQDKGIGLSGWRYNLGGGLCPETISNPWRTVTTYEVSPGQYDFSREPGKRWFLRAARDRGVEQFIAYSVTPPRRLTDNGFTNCTPGKGTTNLRKGAEKEFARYLVDIAEGFGKLPNSGDRVRFTHISPINEPNFEWNGFPEKGSQEGCRYAWDDIKALASALRAEIQKQNSVIRIVLPEAPSPGSIYTRDARMEKLYKAQYAGYAEMMARDAGVYGPLKPVFAYHAYLADHVEDMIGDRLKARKALDKLPRMTLWQTEYCQMRGPRDEGGKGRDLGMTLALNVARIIHYDLTILEANAWQWWLALSAADYKDGLIYTDFQKPGDAETIYPSKTLWCLGNYSRFIRPGFRRVWSALPNEAIERLHGSAYLSSKGEQLVVVLVNCGSEAEAIKIEVNGGNVESAIPYITSDRVGDDLRKMNPVDLNNDFSVPSRSVVTIVARLGSQKS